MTATEKKPNSKRSNKPKVNVDGTVRIVRKGVKRPYRKHPIPYLLERVELYKKRLKKHTDASERLDSIRQKYADEIIWKRKEAGELADQPEPGSKAEQTSTSAPDDKIADATDQALDVASGSA